MKTKIDNIFERDKSILLVMIGEFRSLKYPGH